MEHDDLRDSFAPEEWKDIAYLDDYDKRVMGALLYSLAVTSQASDWTLITSMEKLRERCHIKNEKLYEVCNKLELLGFFKWVRGKKRVAGEPKVGATFIFNQDLIYNPPSEMPSKKELLMRKFNLGTVKVNTNINTKASANTKENESTSVIANRRINKNSNKKINTNTTANTEETGNVEDNETEEGWFEDVLRILEESYNYPRWKFNTMEETFKSMRKPNESAEDFSQRFAKQF